MWEKCKRVYRVSVGEVWIEVREMWGELGGYVEKCAERCDGCEESWVGVSECMG